MRFFALATDYDGTLATEGRVDDATIAALERLKASGRRLVLVTGRRLDDLQRALARIDLFDRVVAENGAVVFDPATEELRVLEAPPPPKFVAALRARGVEPLDVGHVIVATWGSQETAVLDTIRTLGLELHVEFNKGAVMVLPAGVTKRTGLAAALEQLELSPHNVVGVGDAENDHAFLSACGFAVSVQNALPSLKERSDWVTRASEGAGIVELIDRMLADDLASLAPRSQRHALSVGEGAGGAAVTLDVQTSNVLLVGPSGSGKSAVATALVERLLDLGYQLCVIDPEGDHDKVAPLAAVGSAEHPPTVDEVERLLAEPRHSAAATLLAVPIDERPRWFGALLGRIEELRAKCGRPHFVVVDEAHHVLPARGDAALPAAPHPPRGVMLVTVSPPSLSRAALDRVNFVIATAPGAEASLRAFADATGRRAPRMPEGVEPARRDDHLRAIAWRIGDPAAIAIDVPPPRHQHLRHERKDAQGDLGQDDGSVERAPDGSAAESRAKIRAAIDTRYTLPE